MSRLGIVVVVIGLTLIVAGFIAPSLLQIGAYWVVEVSPTSYSLSIAPGASVAGTVEVTSSLSSVSLVSKDVPFGILVNFNPSSGTPPFTSTMTISKIPMVIISKSFVIRVGCTPEYYGVFKVVSVTVGEGTPNESPVASFAYPINDPMVKVDASASYDTDGTIVDYYWTWGDGGSGYGKINSHIYSSNGTYTITLKVTDDKGGTDTTSKSVTIRNAVAPPKQYRLTINVQGQGKVNVSYTLYPSQIIEERVFLEGMDLRLYAVPNSGYEFEKWGGDASGTTNPTYITMNSDKSVGAYFKEPYVPDGEPDGEEYSLTVSSNPPEGGTVSGGGTYPEGEFVTVTATPSGGYVFDHWSFDASGSSSSFTVVMEGDKLVMANFRTMVSTYKLYGYVKDANTQENLEGVSIEADGKKTTSGIDGYYEMDLALGSYDVVAYKAGYEPVEGEITMIKKDHPLMIVLTPIGIEPNWYLILAGISCVLCGAVLVIKGRRK